MYLTKPPAGGTRLTSPCACKSAPPRAEEASDETNPLPLPAGALAMLAPRPAAGPTLPFLQLLLGPANPAFSGHLLLGILNPADELIAGQGRDVVPGIECRVVGDLCMPQVWGQLVHYPTRYV